MWHFVFFSEEIVKCFFFSSRNNEAPDVFKAEIMLAGLLRLQAQVPDHFLRKKNKHFIILLQNKLGTPAFLQQKIRHLIISSEKNSVCS